jgi:hypothetical protein
MRFLGQRYGNGGRETARAGGRRPVANVNPPNAPLSYVSTRGRADSDRAYALSDNRAESGREVIGPDDGDLTSPMESFD